jgi:hypothetical protein
VTAQDTGPSRAVVGVTQGVNDHGTMTVEVAESNDCRHVVAFAEGLRAVFDDLPEGTTVPVEMERLHTRGNCWRITAVGPTGRGDPRSGAHRRVGDGARTPVSR